MPYGTVNADVIQTSTSGGILGAGDASSMKNRIINGAMVIDQRNAGASVTSSTSNPYSVDRWQTYASQNSKFTAQQNAGSVTPPVGFVNYLGVTSSSAYSVGAGDYFSLRYAIEGYNVADLGWGTASAKTVTLSFQVYSSLTGTFGGTFQNATSNRSYPFTYTISSANTWTTISITIAGDTTGTWVTNNGIGIQIWMNLGAGSTYSGTAGSWSANNYISATGATSVVGTNGATFYITGVQLEVGSSATGFEYRQYTTEFTLCQRYYQKIGQATGVGNWYNNTAIQAIFDFPVTMRTAPTASTTGALTFFDGKDQITETTGAVNDSDLCETGGRCNIGSFPSNTVAYRFYEFASPFSNNRYATFSAEL
jgi:hypothetical protein